MHRAIVNADGCLELGQAAERAGFTPGQMVDILVTSSGILMVTPADLSVVIDLDASRLPAGRARLAIGGRTR